MGKIIINEGIKFFKSRKNKLLIGLIIVLIISINIWGKNQRNNFYNKKLESLNLSYDIAQTQIKTLQDRIQFLEETEEEEELDKELEGKFQLEKTELNEKLQLYNNESTRVNMIRSIIEDIIKKEGGKKALYSEEEQKEYYINFSISRYNNILEAYEKNFVPRDLLELRGTSIYDIKRELFSLKYAQENQTDYSINPYKNTGVDSINTLFQNIIIIILFSVFTFFIIDIFLSEIEEGSYKLLYTQPYERRNVFFGKIFSIFIVTALIFFLIIGVQLLIGTIVNGIGSNKAPFVASENIMNLSLTNEETGFQMITISKNIRLSIIAILTVLLLNISIIGFLSIHTDSLTKTLGIEIILILLTVIIRHFVPMDQIIHGLNPFSYLFTQDIITQRINGNYLLGILLNLGLSVVLILLSYQKFNKKDFLGAKV
jgi:ABC-type transport system involved in multi-copper enzyme maturation permease subunit